MGENNVAAGDLHAKHSVREGFLHDALDFDGFFFGHSSSSERLALGYLFICHELVRALHYRPKRIK
jgi:hypothetical protein